MNQSYYLCTLPVKNKNRLIYYSYNRLYANDPSWLPTLVFVGLPYATSHVSKRQCLSDDETSRGVSTTTKDSVLLLDAVDVAGRITPSKN